MTFIHKSEGQYHDKKALHSNSSLPQLFDRSLYRKRRSATIIHPWYRNFLEEISKRLIKRLSYLTKNFPKVLQIGNDQGLLKNFLEQHKKTQYFITLEEKLPFLPSSSLAIVGDEENLPLAFNSFDLVIHFLNLHAVNDVPGVLTQTLKCLKPDGLMLAAFVGQDTFKELKVVFEELELDRYQGISQRISPWISTRDAGSLLQRAGFSIPAADCDHLKIFYPHLKFLLQDLKSIGATSFLMNRKAPILTRKLLKEAEHLYQEKFWDKKNLGVSVSIDIVYMTGWRSDLNHQKPLIPGSAMLSLETALL